MRAVVQRVESARVEVEGHVVGAIEQGLLAYIGFGRADTDEDRAWILSKILTMRIFEDDAGKMNRSIGDVAGGLLLVSQFTLYGDMRRGRRPSFDEAMAPELAEQCYEAVVRDARATGTRVQTGRFRADMQIHSINDGPVTIWLDSTARAVPRNG
jgi:D-tyrosyl-tRNA(Tyr) deacylase